MIFQSNKPKRKTKKKETLVDFGKLKKYKDKMAPYYRKWEENTLLYEGKHWQLINQKYPDLSTLDKVTVNYPFSMLFTMLPGLYYRNPYVFATPQPGMEIPDVNEKIRIATAILNIELQDIGKKRMMKEAIQLAILDSLICNFGLVKVGYLKKLKTKTGDKTVEATTEHIYEDSFFVDRIDPMNVIIDPDVKDLRAIRWIAVKYRKKFSDLKNDKSLNQKAVKKIISDWRESQQQDWGEPEYVDIYEYWDKEADRYSWIHLDSEVVLKEEKNPYKFFPYITLVMYLSRSKGMGLSLIELIKALIIELDIFRSKHITSVRKTSNIFIMETAGRASNKVKEALRNAKDMDVVEVPPNSRIGLKPLEFSNKTIDVERVSAMIKQQLQETGAIPDFEMGVTAKTKSATEASIMANVSSIRKGYLRDRVSDFVKDIVNAIASIIKYKYLGKKTTYLDAGGNRIKFEYSGLDLEDGFNFDIDVDSMQYVDLASQKRNLLELITILSGNPIFVEYIKEDIPIMINELIRLSGFEYLGIKAKTAEELMEEQQAQQQQMLQQGQPMTATPQDIAMYNEELKRRMSQGL